jgi:CheY-like chemotaxis protein
MTATTPILVATEALADAQLVKKLLDEEFDNVAISTKSEMAVQDFEKHRPAVLILAFDSLEQAERYYLGLYRRSTVVHSVPHHTLILCNKNDLWRVYELCKKQHFDDYVLFWPVTNDAPRLRMAVHHALRQRQATGPDAVTSSQLAAHARGLGELEKHVNGYAAEGEQRLRFAGASLAQAEQAIHRALDVLSEKLSAAASPEAAIAKDPGSLQQEIDRIRIDEIGKHFASAAATVNTMRQWAGALTTDLGPQLESARALQALAEQIRPMVLVVDDDEFQHTLLKRLLAAANADLIFATSCVEALATLRSHRPDLILMDVDLPDVNGVEATRRLKAVKHLSGIPIVMITGHSEKTVVVESLQAGASDFVVKPFDRTALLAKVGKFLGIPDEQ